MPTFTYTTQAEVLTLLATRLGDTSMQWWAATEIRGALHDALRMINAACAYDRAEGGFNTIDGQVLYHLPQVLRGVEDDAYLRAQTVTDADLVAVVRRRLLEDATQTGHIALTQIVTALQHRRDLMIAETGCTLVERTYPVSAGQAAIELDEDVFAIRRLAVRFDGGRWVTLRSSDELAQRSHIGSSPQSASTPFAYSTTASAPMTVRLMPPPANSGVAYVWCTAAGATFDTTQASSTLVGVPDDFTPYIAWGAIYDLLMDDEARDPDRATQAIAMWRYGLELLKNAPIILSGAINDVARGIGAIERLDSIRAGWQAARRKRPDSISVVGPEAVVLADTPDARPVTVSMDVVRAARVPANDGAYLQLPVDLFESALALTQWMLMFKSSQHGEVQLLLQTALDSMYAFARRRHASGKMLDVMFRFSYRQRDAKPYEYEPTPPDQSEVVAERNARRRKTVGSASSTEEP